MNRIERHRGTVVILAALAAALVAYGLIVGFVIEPPPLGWVGFAIVSAVVLGLGLLAPLAFERTRVSALRPAEATTPQRRLLVIADPNSDASALSDRILARLGDAIVHVVVPLRVSRLHFVTDDEDRERRDARESMLRTVALLQQRAAVATGSLGSDKPLESMTDALGSFRPSSVSWYLRPAGAFVEATNPSCSSASSMGVASGRDELRRIAWRGQLFEPARLGSDAELGP
jgi:hypothetical protein